MGQIIYHKVNLAAVVRQPGLDELDGVAWKTPDRSVFVRAELVVSYMYRLSARYQCRTTKTPVILWAKGREKSMVALRFQVLQERRVAFCVSHNFVQPKSIGLVLGDNPIKTIFEQLQTSRRALALDPNIPKESGKWLTHAPHY